MEEHQLKAVLKFVEYLNGQEDIWNTHSIDVTLISFEVSDSDQTYNILKNEDGSFYVVPMT